MIALKIILGIIGTFIGLVVIAAALFVRQISKNGWGE